MIVVKALRANPWCSGHRTYRNSENPAPRLAPSDRQVTWQCGPKASRSPGTSKVRPQVMPRRSSAPEPALVLRGLPQGCELWRNSWCPYEKSASRSVLYRRRFIACGVRSPFSETDPGVRGLALWGRPVRVGHRARHDRLRREQSLAHRPSRWQTIR